MSSETVKERTGQEAQDMDTHLTWGQVMKEKNIPHKEEAP
jgi:hypothetical protein